MYIKEGLVYNKATGSLIGFSDLSGVIQQLDDYERSLSDELPQTRPLFVMMVRGIFCHTTFLMLSFQMHLQKLKIFSHCYGELLAV